MAATNSSLSIKPGQSADSKITKYSFVKFKKNDSFQSEVELTKDIKVIVKELANGILNFQIIKNDKICVEKNEHNISFNEVSSISEKELKFKHNTLKIENGKVIIKKDSIETIINYVFEEDEKFCVSILSSVSDKFYGFGEKTGMNLDKKFSDTSNWNTDAYKAHCDSDQEIYASINYSIINRKALNNTAIFLDNPGRVQYDMRMDDEFYIKCLHNDLDLFIISEKSLKDISFKFSELTGKTYMPPKWGMGHHLSKHSYENSEKIHQLVEGSKKSKLKIEAIYLDILHMDRMRSFTVDRERYNDFEELIKYCQENEIQIVPINNPGVRNDDSFDVYQRGLKADAFLKDSTGKENLVAEVWPGDCVFPDFFNENNYKYYNENMNFYLDKGIRGIWIDMNEPAAFGTETKTVDYKSLHKIKGVQVPHEEVHNKYGLRHSEMTYKSLTKNNNRPHLVSRAGYAGSQKYTALWTGDNFSYWFQLEQSLPMILNISLSGVPMTGPDIGGFEYDCSPELLVRWYQANVLFAFFRNHCSIKRREQEPWTYDDKTIAAVKKVLDFRNEVFPSLYTSAYESHKTGSLIVRPLFYNFEKDQEAYNIDNQYCMGENILVSPILRKNTFKRLTYLPKNGSGWVNYFEKNFQEEGSYVIQNLKLEDFGIWIQNKSIIFTTDKDATKYGRFKKVEVKIYDWKNEGQAKPALFHDDDGETLDFIERNDFEDIEFTYENKQLKFKSLNKNIDLKEIEKKFTFKLITEKETKVIKIEKR